MPTIRENLLTLRAVIEAAPTELFDLGYTHNKVDCGSAFCVFGWAAACRKFPGLRWEKNFPESAEEFGSVWYNDVKTDFMAHRNELDVLFGEHSHSNLFQAAGEGFHDFGMGYSAYSAEGVQVEYTNEEQKALALARIDKQLESYP